jgi:Ca-activated chloride channel family protein
MIFAYPWVLAALLIVPFLYFLLHQRERRRRGLAFPYTGIVQTHAWDSVQLILEGPGILRLLVLSLLIVALARPQRVDQLGRKSTEGLDIMLVLDTSNSMLAMDFVLDGKQQNRLQVVKRVVENFIQKRTDDRIGLVIFGSQAYTQAPLTMDHQVLHEFLKPVNIGMAGPETAIGDSLAIAVKRLKDLEAKSKVVILLTDGSNTAGDMDPKEAARIAKTLGVKVYTIGVGSNEPVPFPVRGFWGVEYRSQIIKMDVELMQFIAETTGGRFFTASDTETLQKIYDTIDQLEKTKKEWDQPKALEEYAWVFLLAALGFMALEQAWLGSRWRVVP